MYFKFLRVNTLTNDLRNRTESKKRQIAFIGFKFDLVYFDTMFYITHSPEIKQPSKRYENAGF